MFSPVLGTKTRYLDRDADDSGSEVDPSKQASGDIVHIFTDLSEESKIKIKRKSPNSATGSGNNSIDRDAVYKLDSRVTSIHGTTSDHNMDLNLLSQKS